MTPTHFAVYQRRTLVLVVMWEFLIILILGTCSSLGLQGSDTCAGDSSCIPLSECSSIKQMLQDDKLLEGARRSMCGYFHEPYVCCEKNCYTPNGNYGQIVPLDSCPHLKVNAGSVDRRKRKFLAESHLNKSHVCCNEGEDTYRQIPPAPVGALEPSIPLESSCLTPNGEKATCKHINDCEAYKKVAKKTDEHFHFINDSFCGIWKEPMVCCGDASDYKQTHKGFLPGAEVCGEWDTLVDSIPPWLALITHSSKTCVGAVINQEYVLATVKCVGPNYKKLDLRIGECINDKTQKNCRFQVKELTIFPLHTYLFTEDIGMVLLKLNRVILTEDYMPICLPATALAGYEDINVVGVERSGAIWKEAETATLSQYNEYCDSAMKMYFERIICMKEQSLCSDIKRPLLQNFVQRYENGWWHLVGLFNKENCYGDNNYLNAIYVYNFVPWIKSNLYVQ